MDPFEQEITEALAPALKDDPPGLDSPPPGASRILLVAPIPPRDLVLAIESFGHTCVCVDRLDAATALIEGDQFEILLLDPAIGERRADLVATLSGRSPAAKVVCFSSEPTAELVMIAMRLGAVDYLHTPLPAEELSERLNAVLAKARVEQRRENRLVRLKAICQELNEARREIAEQLDNLCQEMVSAYEGMNDQMSDIAMASEFRTLLRQELDIEDLLRTALEYSLTKTGPTNAAVFLADGHGRFSLGAYVNYDCPRETIAEVLERLGGVVCPQMEGEPEIVSFEDAREFVEWLDIEGGLPGGAAFGSLAESQVISFSCQHDGETLAVIVLFRAKAKPFDESLPGAIETLRPIFAAQLANVMRIHHRAMPAWPKEARGETDEYDFEDGYGFGPLAA